MSFLPLGRNKHLKYSCRLNGKPSHPLRWDLTRGRGDEGQRLIHSWHDSLVTQVETGKLTREVTWEKNLEVMRGVAEEVVGRGWKTNDMPCLRACRKEVLLSKWRVAESYARLQDSRQTEDFGSESERHRRVKRRERDCERKRRKEAVALICAELESACENHETGKQYRLLREFGVNLRDGGYSGIEAITPEGCRQHFLKISGEPNEPPLNAADQVPQQQVNAELDRKPTFEEFVKTLHEMKVSAPGDDEITVDMIETAPIPIQECILRLLVKMYQEADNEGEQEHWSPAVHKAVVLMLYKRKGDFRSLDNCRGICLLSMISRVLARLAISRCSKYLKNLGIMVNEQWGFRRARSTRDVTLVARIVAEILKEADQRWNGPALGKGTQKVGRPNTKCSKKRSQCCIWLTSRKHTHPPRDSRCGTC